MQLKLKNKIPVPQPVIQPNTHLALEAWSLNRWNAPVRAILISSGNAWSGTGNNMSHNFSKYLHLPPF